MDDQSPFPGQPFARDDGSQTESSSAGQALVAAEVADGLLPNIYRAAARL